MTSNRAPTSRFIHTTTSSPTHNDILYKQGQRQYKISLVRYHRLCAAIQQKYVIREVPPDMSKGQLFPRKAISFTPYTEFALDPVVGIKLHPREDGTIHPGDIKVYKRWFLNNWKCREGGILYCIGESREFWNMVLNFHSEAGTTGMKAWDALFERLKGNVFDKQLVPCMVKPLLYPRRGNTHSFMNSGLPVRLGVWNPDAHSCTTKRRAYRIANGSSAIAAPL